jgi:hypothetical protein
MSICPSVLHRAKKPVINTIRTIFNGKEYFTSVPSKPAVKVKDFLSYFTESFIQDKTYKDFLLCKKDQWINYDDFLNQEGDEAFNLVPSELNQLNFYERRKKVVGEEETDDADKILKQGFYYKPDELDDYGNFEEDRNFFLYILKIFPQYSLCGYGNQNITIQNLFNEAAANEAYENALKTFSNPWLFNKNSYPKIVTALNVQEWDKVYHQNMLTQILTPIISKNRNFTIDIDTSITASHHHEKFVSILLKNQKNETSIPLTVVDNIDQNELFDHVRREQYAYEMAKRYPLHDSEQVDPDNLTEEDIKIADEFNESVGTIQFNFLSFRFEKKLRLLDFKNF